MIDLAFGAGREDSVSGTERKSRSPIILDPLSQHLMVKPKKCLSPQARIYNAKAVAIKLRCAQ